MNHHVIGLFYSAGDAANALEALLSGGIERGEISLLASQEHAAQFEVPVDGGNPGGKDGLIGAALGLGATLISTGAHGQGMLAVGPVLVSMAGLGVSGVGGVVGALVGLGLPEQDAQFYEVAIHDYSAVLIGVATLRHDNCRTASILQFHNGDSIAAAI